MIRVLGCTGILITMAFPCLADTPLQAAISIARKATTRDISRPVALKSSYSSNLRAFLARYNDDAHAQAMNGDPITGSQEPNRLDIVKSSFSGNKVSISYSGDGGAHSFEVTYLMVKEGASWKINDIRYGRIGPVGPRDFRAMASAPVER